MLKLAILIMSLKCPHIKQIKTNHEAQFLTDLILNDEIKKIIKNNIKNNLNQFGLTY